MPFNAPCAFLRDINVMLFDDSIFLYYIITQQTLIIIEFKVNYLNKTKMHLNIYSVVFSFTITLFLLQFSNILGSLNFKNSENKHRKLWFYLFSTNHLKDKVKA